MGLRSSHFERAESVPLQHLPLKYAPYFLDIREGKYQGD
jgi:hypothetical protein